LRQASAKELLVAVLALLGHGGGDGALLGGAQPLGVLGLLGQPGQHEEAGDHRGNAFKDEQPLPVGQMAHVLHAVHDGARDRAAHGAGDGERGHEQAVDARAVAGREPVGQIQHHAGEEARLDHAQDEAQHIEHGGRGHIGHGHGGRAPEDGDARQRLACADLLQQQVAGHFEQEVADEEDAGAQAVDSLAELQVLQHLQLGEADVDAVYPGQDKEKDQKGDQAPGDLAVGGVHVGVRGAPAPAREWVAEAGLLMGVSCMRKCSGHMGPFAGAPCVLEPGDAARAGVPVAAVSKGSEGLSNKKF
jgi:hypothetical protein